MYWPSRSSKVSACCGSTTKRNATRWDLLFGTAGHVAELVYTGKDIDAARAATIGLVNDVYADFDAVVAAALAMAHEIAANSPLAVQGSKAVLRAGSSMTVEQGLDYVALWNSAFLPSTICRKPWSHSCKNAPRHSAAIDLCDA